MFDLMPFGKNQRSLWDPFEDFEREFFSNRMPAVNAFKTDVLDKGDHYVLEAELPGFNKEDIHIELNGDYLTIHAEHNEEEKKEDKKFVTRERRYGSFSRSFNVSNVKVDQIEAEYKNGVLELKLPKQTEEKPQVRSIEIR
jgi:HSP20 family protein